MGIMTGDWRLETGDWRLETGDWRLETGDWRLENYNRDEYNVGMKRPLFRRIAKRMGWTRSSYYLMSAFLAMVFLIIYVWWPLAEEALAYVDWQGQWWLYMDWLLLGIFAVMSLLIMAGADLRVDAWIVFVGMVGGLVIESWGTQTEIWWYYTAERPPLWIIPAWPIASLSIDRLVRLLRRRSPKYQFANSQPTNLPIYPLIYWIIFPAFFALMLTFVWPTVDKSLTVIAIILVGFLILTPTNHRIAVLTFVAGSGLGYYLELWGTTRQCWTYYTLATPPLFAVLAHGMAAVAFWRTARVLKIVSALVIK
ncbi:MAG: hypothetical protein KKD28_01700 [Chloroflexi bacterium]|nr:hypothetical protein [Chloroflexota bacterium]MBU1660169.1 hypothetical protein [Chloroflexota bacterium]